MMKSNIYVSIIAGLFFSTAIFAVPTLQVYIDGATAGTVGGDEDTWFTGSSSFDLILVGAYGPKTTSLQFATLVASVPQGQTGSITVNGASLLTNNTDTDILTNVSGKDGFATKSFAPDNFNNHYPFQNSVSDFVLYDVGSFANNGTVHNYDADSGTITSAGSGQEKTFAVDVSGFDRVHFDMYAYETDLQGNCKLRTTWDINPGSHDATALKGPSVIPAPGAILLSTIGVGLVGWLRNHRIF